jgi:uncharacterized membrane protein
MWMAIAITAMIFAIGNILFGHFEERTPKWGRVAKVLLVTGCVWGVPLGGLARSGAFSRQGSCSLLSQWSIYGGYPAMASMA